ncbi:MAG TPA: carboxypeptidase-like regulatory domain-containing protein, partial [Sphingomicrobium sp.]
MKKSLLLRSCAFLAMPIAANAILSTAAYAQETTGTITGEVSSNGTPIGGAQVVVTHVPSGTVSRTTTDASG